MTTVRKLKSLEYFKWKIFKLLFLSDKTGEMRLNWGIFGCGENSGMFDYCYQYALFVTSNF